MPNVGVTESVNLTKTGQGLVSNSDCSTGVTGLLLFGNESTIFGRVVPINVDPLNSQRIFVTLSKRPVSEQGKVVPFLGDSNSAATVVGKSTVAWIQTSVPHRSPNAIQARLAFAMGPIGQPGQMHLPIGLEPFFCQFRSQASTRNGPTLCERLDVNPSLFATFTLAQPVDSRTPISTVFNAFKPVSNGEPAEFSTS